MNDNDRIETDMNETLYKDMLLVELVYFTATLLSKLTNQVN